MSQNPVIQAHQTLDCRETLCPGPVIEVSKAIRRLGLDQVLEVLASDPGFLPDIEAFSKRTGHPLVAVESHGLVSRVLIRRAR
ncbi:MAG TPA: sulfurtransferase TusA family protein [Methylomirabilota bacterium]|nr:sulfurtransferase TusA family protein [Methylomirabilota bacterium]